MVIFYKILFVTADQSLSDAVDFIQFTSSEILDVLAVLVIGLFGSNFLPGVILEIEIFGL